MKVYKTQQDVEKDIRNKVLAIKGDVKFECSISINASIVVTDGDITAENITARDINARDVTAENVNVWDINARDVTADDVTADNITARNIKAESISYYAFCCAYGSITCSSIKAKREVHQEPICLDGKLTIKDK